MRGGGTIFSRGNVLGWTLQGTESRVGDTSDEKAARKLLKQRLKQVERPGFGSKEMWTLPDMRARIEASYARKQNRSLKTVQYCFKHLEAAFQFRGYQYQLARCRASVAVRRKAGSVRERFAYLPSIPKPRSRMRATGRTYEGLGAASPAPGMSLCVSSPGQADCLVQESIQGGCC